MITYNPKLWLIHIFKITKSDTLRILWPQMLGLGIISFIITYIELTYISEFNLLKDTGVIYTLIGFVLSLLLVFRTNTAYDRWWEGRKKWGELLNNSRNLAIKIGMLKLSKADNEFFSRMLSNFSIALKNHLRNIHTISELRLSETEKTRLSVSKHLPNSIIQILYEALFDIKKKGLISDIELSILDQNLNEFLNISGSCERIKNTPIPYSYSLFFKKFVFVYVTTVPIAFVASLGYGTVLMAVFVFYVIVSIEILAEEIEDPFGTDDNDLPLDDICLKIKNNVAELLQT